MSEISAKGKTSNNATKPSIFEKLVPILLVVTVGLAFLVGVLWQRVENFGKVTPTGTEKADNASRSGIRLAIRTTGKNTNLLFTAGRK